MSNKKKIIYLVEYWLPPGTPGSTGGTLFNYQLVAALAKLADVQVLALNAPSMSVPRGASIRKFQEPLMGRFKSRVFTWRRTLMAQLPREGGDVLLITTSATNAVLDLAKKRGFTTISVVQAYEDFGFKVSNANYLQRLRSLKRLLVTGQGFRPNIYAADQILVNSIFMENALEGILKLRNPKSVLYPPLTLAPDFSHCFSADARRSVGFVNRAGKNIEFVVQLAVAVPERRFLVFGHALPKKFRLPENMLFCGWATDKKNMYQQANTWIMPSIWLEPFGLVAIEALSQGCRVGVSDRGGLVEAVAEVGKVFYGFDVSEWRHWLLLDVYEHNAGMTMSHLDIYSLDQFESKVKKFILEACSLYGGYHEP